MSVKQKKKNGNWSAVTVLKIILRKFVPPSLIKKKKTEDGCATPACPLRVRGKTLRTSFLEGKASSERGETPGRKYICLLLLLFIIILFYISMTFLLRLQMKAKREFIQPGISHSIFLFQKLDLQECCRLSCYFKRLQ